jgi:hypothetical protein
MTYIQIDSGKWKAQRDQLLILSVRFKDTDCPQLDKNVQAL